MLATDEVGWRRYFPEGRGIADDVWERRHRMLSWIVIAHLIFLFGFGLFMGETPGHVAFEIGMLGVLLIVAHVEKLPRLIRATSMSISLLAGSAMLVHFSGGYIEAHFHFFVVLPLVALYQRWFPFLVSVGFVVIHHGLVGVIDPPSVYNHAAAIAHPWTWAGIHAIFVALECLALFRLWFELENNQAVAEKASSDVSVLLENQAVKDRFLWMASHELNTPLTPIKLQLRMLSDGRMANEPKRRDAGFKILERNFSRLERVVSSVLDVVKMDNDGIRLSRQTVDVALLGQAALESYQQVAKDQGVVLVGDFSPAIAAVDAERVSQVIDNLLSNAVKYSPVASKITLRIKPEGDDVMIEVDDAGTGLDQQQIDKLFAPFAMVQGEQDQAQGTGLGLYICKGIVEGHGGKIGASSPGHGKGSKFWARLPTAAPAAPIGTPAA